MLIINPTVINAQSPSTCFGRQPTILNTQSNTIVNGTDGDDVILSTGSYTDIYGKGGNDIICGGLSSRIYGSNGNNIITGSGKSIIYGGKGSNIIFAQAGPGNDGTLNSTEAESGISGVNCDPSSTDPGTSIYGSDDGTGNDVLVGCAGHDYIKAGNNKTKIYGYGGIDQLIGGSNTPVIYGNDGDDNILAGPVDTLISGGEGNDYLRGGIGNDSIDAGNGNNSVYSGDGNDRIMGGSGGDELFGENGDDYIDGGGGSNLIDGGPGQNTCQNGDPMWNCMQPSPTPTPTAIPTPTPTVVSYFLSFGPEGRPGAGWDTADELLTLISNGINNAIEIDQWKNGGWDGHIKNLPFNNFNISEGNGYLIKFRNIPDLSFYQLLNDYISSSRLTYNIFPGWNIFSIPSNLVKDLGVASAESICKSINKQNGSVTEVDRHPVSSDASLWIIHPCGSKVNNFPVSSGEAYMVKAKVSSAWTLK